MKVLPALGLVVLALGSLFLFVRPRIVPTHHVSSSQVARVLEQLRQSTADPTFAVFMFSTQDQPGAERALNVQFSLENGDAKYWRASR
jgi:hypothetical protein